ncbi:MAG: DUF2062 domain-containing protein [Lentisphaeria bacterium]|nr:DUF2062 domain-containing protein [Lentisphaeria bacterium]
MGRSFYRRHLIRLYAKIVREKASPEYIARGWAIGMFYGCLVPFGFQLILSIPTAFLLKASKIGATVGTLITNHFTIFIIYPVHCYVGALLMGRGRGLDEIRRIMEDVIRRQSYEALWSIGLDLVAAFFIGGALLTAVMTPLTYFFVKGLVIRYRKRKSGQRTALRQ